MNVVKGHKGQNGLKEIKNKRGIILYSPGCVTGSNKTEVKQRTI